MTEMRDADIDGTLLIASMRQQESKLVLSISMMFLLQYALHVVNTEEEAEESRMKAKEESTLSIDLKDNGVCIKADTLGGLEALAFEP